MLDLAAANWNTSLGAACFLACALDTLHTDRASKMPLGRRLRDLEHRLEADVRTDGGRDVTTYAITGAGQAALRAWMDTTPAGFPVLKHPVLLRLLVGHVTEPEQTRQMLHEYVAELDQALVDLGQVRESLRGADEPGQPFRFPSLVAEWGLEYFDAERRHTHRALASLDETGHGDTDATA